MYHDGRLRNLVFRTISPLLIMTALGIGVLPALAQNVVSAQSAVPPTTPRGVIVLPYAPPLVHPAATHATRRPTRKHAPMNYLRTRFGSPQDGIVYENGPVDGQDMAWTINFGYTVSNSMQASGDVITGLNFWVWLTPGDTLTSVEVQMGAAPFGNELFDQTLTFTASNCFANQLGYYVCLESSNITNGPTVNGNAWVTLLNANIPSGDPAYWDQNFGVGCNSPGCPSLAQENTLGTIPSEAFTVIGQATTSVPPPQCFNPNGNPQVIHDFTAQEAGLYGGNGVTIDKAGNLYGTTTAGGDAGLGLAFKQYPAGDGWIFSPLYSFTGGYAGNNPNGVIVGPNGSLYGGAFGGIQNCGSDGSQYCGLVFNLTPLPTTCLTTRCSWMERVPYRFSGGTDAYGAINLSAFDQQGNLYGTSTAGGAGDCNGVGCGTVFKLTPTVGGWAETILYTFTGGNDGYAPTQVLLGNDGNLYGVADGGAYGRGVVFQLTPVGDHWVESVPHTFQGTGIDGERPSSLVQDGAGNLYGIAFWYFEGSFGPIFMLQKSAGGWIFSEYLVHHPNGNFEVLNNLAIDASGNLYGTGGGGQGCSGGCNGSPDDYPYMYAYIFQAGYGGDGWQYQDLAYFGYQIFPVNGALALDAAGNLYGTTVYCGANDAGTVWKFSR